MENLIIEKDKRVIVCQASSFPDGIMDAFQKLHSKVPDAFNRTTYGISRPEGSMDHIVYKAAVDESYKGEGKELGFATVIIPAGSYKSITIKDFMKNPQAIGSAFTELLKTSELDSEGFCLEIYKNDNEVICAVPLKRKL
ncbi:hypothetical protein [Niabella hibiscisoli]|uniref:hypothetical protein n=1 Tax=Niabella hibiscisoli TaxID=1825928 RepID=UPI001F10AA4E|nr:hypothetical protein [Niabella hibiscisoli]MCH5718460.1 hypothetical protein [Niabella hibiscisoli]